LILRIGLAFSLPLFLILDLDILLVLFGGHMAPRPGVGGTVDDNVWEHVLRRWYRLGQMAPLMQEGLEERWIKHNQSAEW